MSSVTPFVDLLNTLSAFIKGNSTSVKNCTASWPDTRYLNVDDNLPSVFMQVATSKPLPHRGRLYGYGGSDTTHVVEKREYPITLHIMAYTKDSVVQIHDDLMQAFADIPFGYLGLTTNQQNTRIRIINDGLMMKGEETRLHRALIVIGASLQLLSTETGLYPFEVANITDANGNTTATLDVGTNSFTLD